MNSLLTWLENDWTTALGWTLMHSVWQCAALAAFAALALRLCKSRSPQSRYLIGCAALAAMLCASLATFWLLLAAPAAGDSSPFDFISTPAAAQTSASTITVPSDNSSSPGLDRLQIESVFSWTAAGVLARFPWFLPALVVAWVCGVLLHSTRLAAGWFQVQRWKRSGTPAANQQLQSQLDELALRFGITRAVTILESKRVEVPTVFGWLQPVILLPVTAFIGLTPFQLQSILAHEIAHIHRSDYLANFFQNIVEGLLFYHPAVWWVSNQIRLERENCCDDMAIAIGGDRVGYVKALAAMEECRATESRWALAGNGGSLVRRSRRLLGLTSAPPPAHTWLGGAALLLAAALTGFLILKPAEAGQNPSAAPSASENSPENVPPAAGRPLSPDLSQPIGVEGRSLGFLAQAGAPAPRPSSPDKTAILLQATVAEIPEDMAADLGLDFVLNSTEPPRNIETAHQKRIQEHDKKYQRLHEEMRALRLRFRISDADAGADPAISEAARKLASEKLTAELAALEHETLHRELKRKTSAELRQTLLTSHRDALLLKLLEDLSRADQNLALLSSNFSENHPETKKAKDLLKTLNSQIDDRVKGILEGVELQASQQKARAESIAERLNELRDLEMARAEAAAPYFKLKREMELQERLLHAALAAQSQDATPPVPSPNPAVLAVFNRATAETLIKTLGDKTGASIVSRPRILTAPGVAGSMFVGDEANRVEFEVLPQFGAHQKSVQLSTTISVSRDSKQNLTVDRARLVVAPDQTVVWSAPAAPDSKRRLVVFLSPSW